MANANDWQLGFHERVKNTRDRIKVISDQLQAFDEHLTEMQAIYEQTFRVSPQSEAIPSWVEITGAQITTPAAPAAAPPVSVEPAPPVQVAPKPEPSPPPVSAPPAQPAPPVVLPQPPEPAKDPAPVPSPIPVTAPQPAPKPAPTPPPVPVAEVPYTPITLPVTPAPVITPAPIPAPVAEKPVAIPAPAPTVPAQAKTPGKRILFCGSPKPTQALMDKYDIGIVTSLNQYAFDDQHGDGIFHGTGTSNWASRIKLTPEDWTGGIQLDWENADSTPNPNMLSACAGFYDPRYYGDIQQKRIAEMVKAIEAVRSARPQAKIGVYNFPYFYWSAAEDPAGHPWTTQQMTKAIEILKRVDWYMPSMYLGYEIPKDKTLAKVQETYRNAANICLMGDKPVYPFTNFIYFNKGTTHEKGSRIPLADVYAMVQGWNQGKVDGKQIAGVIVWNSVSSGDNPFDEPTIKAFRAALDGQPLSQ